MDPLGVEAVHLGQVGPEKAKVLLAAAVARARAFAGSKPENAKPYVSSRISRRSLLRLSIEEYRSVPSIDQGLCVSATGCNLCETVCPEDALQWSGGRMQYNKALCEPCGLCLTVCPREAIQDPACTPAQIEAQVKTLLTAGYAGPRGIVFRCRKSPEPEMAEGWMPVSLNSVGMIVPSWALAPLLMGAGSVAILTCRRGCPACQKESVEECLSFCREFLRQIGAPEDLVLLNPDLSQEPSEGSRIVSLEDPFGQGGVTEVLISLASTYGAPAISFGHRGSPLGIVEIRERVCTACGVCAQSCPTGALIYRAYEEGVTLTFDAGRCVACGLCLPNCPELAADAISLEKEVNLPRLSQGATVVLHEEEVRCVACGAPIAPSGMMLKVRDLLGEEYSTLSPVLDRYCLDCRILAHGGNL